jgi:hypothetical protein
MNASEPLALRSWLSVKSARERFVGGANIRLSAQTAVEARQPGYPDGEMAKKTEEMLAEAKAAGVEVRVTQRPKGGGEVALLPGVRRPTEDERAADRLEDDDGSGVVE